VVPALARAPGWRLAAEVDHGGERLRFALRGRTARARSASAHPPVGTRAARTGFDSAWERALAAALRQRIAATGGGWTLAREATPVPAGDELLLPDFTLRHTDGREALVELVGFWTPEYLEAKARKVAAAGLNHLVLVVPRGLAVGRARSDLVDAVGMERVVWFTQRPKAAEVLRLAERCARAAS
jgi:predicted nuclease of restriction endonuclease-like RecB superfamily